MYWLYTTAKNNVEDTQDILINVYKISLASDDNFELELPKRVQDRLNKCKST